MQLAILVGGRSSRMGQPKGRILYEGQTLLERAVSLGAALALPTVLVGEAGDYDDLVPAVPRLVDDPVDVGPLGGLRAALLRADTLLLACDMPHVRPSDLEVLVNAPEGWVALSRRARFEPFAARYRQALLPALEAYLRDGKRSFQGLIRGLPDAQLVEVALDPAVLVDWDTPDDVKGV